MELPKTLAFTFISVILLYFMVGFRMDAGGFFFFYFIILLVSLCAEAATMCVSTITPDIQTASAILPVIIVLSMLFGGFFIQSSEIPVYLIWLEYLSFIKYSNHALALNQIPELATNPDFGFD